MHFGYPGENTHLEPHGVSEESFWPSFTDIMMVIVMVFLLVTVTVILNNWSLISDLKSSIQAQKIASSLAKNTKKQNHTLEEKLNSLELQVTTLSAKIQTEKTSHLATQQALAKSRRLLVEKETRLNALETALSEEKTTLQTTKSELEQKLQMLIALQAKLSTSTKQNDETRQAERLLQEKLKASEIDKTKLKAQLAVKEKKILELVRSTKEIDQLQSQLKQLQSENTNLQTSLDTEKQKSQTAYNDLKKNQKTLDNLEQEKLQLINSLNQKSSKLSQAEQQLTSKNNELLALQEKRSKEESQLRSLQGEYETLDAKYQKLLLPARSSKGKYVVSVSYRKSGRQRIIRLKTSPDGSYKTVSEKDLHRELSRLKKKHKTNLYLKVVIPENSGLSYSEAWKFTSGLQKQYDYYYADSPEKNTNN